MSLFTFLPLTNFKKHGFGSPRFWTPASVLLAIKGLFSVPCPGSLSLKTEETWAMAGVSLQTYLAHVVLRVRVKECKWFSMRHATFQDCVWIDLTVRTIKSIFNKKNPIFNLNDTHEEEKNSISPTRLSICSYFSKVFFCFVLCFCFVLLKAKVIELILTFY